MGLRTRAHGAALACGILAASLAAGLPGSAGAQEAPRLTYFAFDGIGALAEQDPIPRAVPHGQVPPPYPPPPYPPPPYPPPPYPPPPPYLPPPPVPPRFEARLEYGIGEMEHETRGSNLDGETDAQYLRLQFEGYGYERIGGGIRLDSMYSDDDLFEDTIGDDIGVSAYEFFIYLAIDAGERPLQLPLRAGFAYQELVIEDDLAAIDVEYSTYGFRFEAEPELELRAGRSLLWTAYSLLGLGFGSTEIETDPSTVDDDAGAFLFGFEIGTRLQWGPALFGVGYIYRLTDIEEGDDFFFAVENEFSGLLLTLGLRW